VWTTRILDDDALGGALGIPVAEVLENVDWYSDGDEKVVSPEGTMRIARIRLPHEPDARVGCGRRGRKAAARVQHPRPPRGHLRQPADAVLLEWEYANYLKEGRPIHDLLRAWYRQRAVTLQERLAAAEAEVHRMDGLLVRGLDELKTHDHSIVADNIERAHIDERITPENVRSVTEHPFGPAEISVR